MIDILSINRGMHIKNITQSCKALGQKNSIQGLVFFCYNWRKKLANQIKELLEECQQLFWLVNARGGKQKIKISCWVLVIPSETYPLNQPYFSCHLYPNQIHHLKLHSFWVYTLKNDINRVEKSAQKTGWCVFFNNQDIEHA